MRRALVTSLVVLSLGASAGAQAPPFLGGQLDHGTIAQRLSVRAPIRVRAVGTSSVTLRLDLSGIEAAYKPRTRLHRRGYQAEIAAYRISTCLGMDNVPPVVGRRLPRRALQDHFEADHPEDWEPIREQILWDAPGVARGAAIYWIPRMESSELATLEGLDAASEWLSLDGELPDDARITARDLSTLIAFDYLIGNWDRFSGGNVSSDGEGRLYVRDHNIALSLPLSDERYQRLRGLLERVQRFSRGFVAALEALDRAAIEAAFAEDPEGAERALLTPAELDALLARRRALLSYVGALVSLYGRDQVLTFD